MCVDSKGVFDGYGMSVVCRVGEQVADGVVCHWIGVRLVRA